MRIIACTFEEHAPAILEILNDAIVHTTALYDYKPRTMENMQSWFQVKQAGNFPVLGSVNEQGQLLGFATYGTFRTFPAYKYSVEHSVYVGQASRGLGVGRQLMRNLIELATAQQYHVLVGGIDASNANSIAFHEKLGFRHAGTLSQVGYKFGRWLDLAFYQLILTTPTEPQDG